MFVFFKQIHRPLLFAILAATFVAGEAQAQQVALSGYVKSEAAYDTRQVLQVREGHLHLYPLPESATSSSDNLLLNAFQSRLTVIGSGTEALGAAVSGVLEGDFLGISNADVNSLRLRHAYVKLAWEHHEFLAGQYWSPLFSPAVLAGVQGSNAGAPFQPFARFTQVRYTWKPGRLHVITALSQQRDAFSSIGGSKSQQQTGLPGAHVHAEYHADDNLFIGAGAYAKTLKPDPSDERFNAFAVQGYGTYTAGPVTARVKLTYGSDLTDHLMLGGYVRTLLNDYETLRVASGWIDLTFGDGLLRGGLFAGCRLSNLAPCDGGHVQVLPGPDGRPVESYLAGHYPFNSEPLSGSGGDWRVEDGTLSIDVLQLGGLLGGEFADWTADITFDEREVDGRHGQVDVEVAVGSLSIGSVTEQALSGDFFDVEAFPTATFSADILPADEGYLAEGVLAIKGREVPVRLPFELVIEGERARMQGTTRVDRRDWEIGESYTDEGTLGFPVTIDVELTASRI